MKTVITRERSEAGGVVYESTDVTRFVPPSRYVGPWSGMMMISQEGMAELDARLADRSLGMQAVRVLVAMLNTVDLHDDNKVRAGRKDLARLLGMSESNVSGAIRQLIECGFVEAPKFKFSPWIISPRFAWYGRTEDLRAALKLRGMLGENGQMVPRAA